MVSDHVVVTPDVAEQYPAPFYEPFTTLSWLAGVTSRVRLGHDRAHRAVPAPAARRPDGGEPQPAQRRPARPRRGRRLGPAGVRGARRAVPAARRADRRAPAGHARRPGEDTDDYDTARSRSGSAATATPACAAPYGSVTPGIRCGSPCHGCAEAAGRLTAIADELGRAGARVGAPHRPAADHRHRSPARTGSPARAPSSRSWPTSTSCVCSARRPSCSTRSTATRTETRQPEARLADARGPGRAPPHPQEDR